LKYIKNGLDMIKLKIVQFKSSDLSIDICEIYDYILFYSWFLAVLGKL